MRWRPRDVAVRVALILVPELLAAGKAGQVKAYLAECPPTPPWDLLLWVPLALAGEPTDDLAIENSLKRAPRGIALVASRGTRLTRTRGKRISWTPS